MPRPFPNHPLKGFWAAAFCRALVAGGNLEILNRRLAGNPKIPKLALRRRVA